MKSPLPSEHDFLAGGGEISRLMRTLDWSKTSLGPIGQWPQSLRTVVSLCLHSRFPMAILWGPELRLLYNQAYRPMLGDKHPQALGEPGQEVWGEVWPVIGPMLEGVSQHGEATWSDDQLLLLDRYGFSEECYFTFSYSAIRDESGNVGGVFDAVTETTERVIQARQLHTSKELNEALADCLATEKVYTRASEVLGANHRDCPFVLIYHMQEAQHLARLVSVSGLAPDAAAALPAIDLSGLGEMGWPLWKVLQQGKAELVPDLVERWGELPGGAWKKAPEQAYLVPIAARDNQAPYAILVVGLNPHRAFDDTYKIFLQTVADRIGREVNRVKAQEEERARPEALLALDRAKTVFFSNISHELRTPLTLMLGPLNDLLEQPESVLPSPHRDQVETAQRNTRRLLKLVNTLLDFSRLQAGRLQASYVPTDLAALTIDIASSFRAAIERMGLTLTMDCPPLAEPVYVDREMWEKIVSNLLSNAYKFTRQGTISVHLRQTGQQATLTVTDSGIGISDKDLHHLFERFYRGKEGRTYEGSGIGLSLTQELVKLHGGTVRVNSQYGQGSSFTVQLPLGKAHLPAEHISPENTPALPGQATELHVQELLQWGAGATTPAMTRTPQDHLAKLLPSRAHILVVDDNADMRHYVERTLSPHYRVTLAADGLEALDLMQEQPDLVLTDIMMPQLDGFGLLQAIRSNPDTRALPVIMLSARAGEEARTEGIAAGADSYLVKPFSKTELLASIQSNLDLSRMRQELGQQLEMQREDFYNLFMQAPAIIYVLRGREGICEMVNPLATARWKNRELLGLPMREAWPELAGQGLYEKVEAVFDTGQPYFANEVAVKGDWDNTGQLGNQYLNIIYSPFRNRQGEIEKVMVFAFDVTEQVAARQQAEASEKQMEYQRRNFYRLFMEAPAAITLLRGREGIVELVNPHAASLWRSRDMLGKPMREVWPDGERQGSFTRFERVFDTGEPFYGSEYPITSDWNNDGQVSTKYLNFVYMPYHNADNETEGVMVFAFDVSTQVKARESMEASAQYFRQLADSMPQMVWTARPDGYLDYYNRQWYEYTGFEEGYGDQSWIPILHPDDVDLCVNTWYNAVRTGQAYTIEYRFKDFRQPGQFRWFLGRALPVRDEAGNIVKWFGTYTDIDDVKKIKGALSESEDRFRVLADQAPVMIWLAGTDKMCNFFNRSWLEFTGRTMEEEVGEGWTAGVYPDDFERCLDIYTSSFDARKAFYMEYRLRRHDGAYHWITDHGAPRYAPDGSFLGYIGSCVDINDLHQAQEELEQRVATRTRELYEANTNLQRSNEDLNQFAYVASHDMQEPLRKIKIFSSRLEAALQDQLDGQTRLYLDKITGAAERMDTLIHNLLQYSRLDRLEGEFRPTDLNEVLENVLNDFELRIQQQQATVESEPLPVVEGIPFQLNQLFFNLIGNSLRFAAAGRQLELRLTARQMPAEEAARRGLHPELAYQEIIFADNGIGFKAEYAEQIFIIFHRLNAKHQFGGTGIGLAICRKIVNLHHGHIFAVSEEGAGARFHVILPEKQPQHGN